MRRKFQESDGDRSHIPREERSFVEYHPTLLTHLALTLVRQASTQHRRTQSTYSNAPTNGRHSISTASNAPTTNGEVIEARTARNGTDTPTRSEISVDLQEAQRDDMYAFGQITSNRMTIEPVDIYQSAPANLFEISPALAHEAEEEEAEAHQDHESVDSAAIDPALLEDMDDLVTPIQLTNPFPLTNGRGPADISAMATEPIVRPSVVARNSHSRGSMVAPSDRFLRSEVSVEEKYERLRREEGFSIGKLHEPTFRPFDNTAAEHKVKLTSNAIAFGYQADRPFERPSQAYIRHIDLPESELADRVEYDMDEQDEYWLAMYNERRKIRDGDTITREIFEITLTKIEKEWTALEKRIPKVEKKDDAAAEDAKCAICDDGECENTNAIVFCDGCNLAVHQG